MFPEIQEIVDDLADDLDRAVVVEDERHALIAHSPHRRHVDAIRERSVFLRQTPAEMVDWVTRQGLRESEGPLRLPPNPELGAESRVCVPIRNDGVIIGFVTVLDAAQTLGSDALDRCGDVAQTLAHLLHDLRFLHQAGFSRERELVEILLSSERDADARAQAGASLIREGRLSTGPTTVVVVFPRLNATRSQGHTGTTHLSHVIRRGRRAFPARSIAAATCADHAALLVPLDVGTVQRPGDAAAQVAQALAPLLSSGVLPEPPLVAYGDEVRGWADVAVSYRRACLAARVAEAVPELDSGTVGWEQLSVYQLLAQVPADELGRTSMDDRIRRLDDKPELLRTLEVYLDLAGEAKRAAGELALHRASLYYRLRRIEELAEIDLKSGMDRLAAHLSIKALRLAGAVDGPARSPARR